MKIWGITKKYKSLSWWENFMGGHLSIGAITIYGANAMNWTVNIRTKKWGYICFTLPFAGRFRKYENKNKKYFDWYFYLSPNGTPWAATYYRGRNKSEVIRAQIRKLNFGHGFKVHKADNYERLWVLNNNFDSFHITDYEMDNAKYLLQRND